MFPKRRRDAIVVGGSAGAVDAFTRLAGLLPANLPACVFLVIHVSALYKSHLPEIINRCGPLRAQHATDGVEPQDGRIYVAPPDTHMLLEDGHIRLDRGPRENAVRPAIDPLFRSAATRFGPRLVGVILSGTLDDGSLGLLDVKVHGGLTLVQDPEDATYPEMPRSAIDTCRPHAVAPIAELAALLAEAVLPTDADIVEPEEAPGGAEAGLKGLDWPPHGTSLTCPGCGGVLYLEGPGAMKLRCQVGHTYAPESLFDEQKEWVESTMWAALRSLREQSTLAKHIADRAERRGNEIVTRLFRRRENESSEHAKALERLLLEHRQTEAETAEDTA
jgi:two-component system chemotaxis response regulator CheB